MSQINFRVSSEEYELIKSLAHLREQSVSSMIKDLSLEAIKSKARIMARELYRAHKVGLKQAWILSQIPFPEFLGDLQKFGIDPDIPANLDDEMISTVETLSFQDFFPGKTREEIQKKLSES